MTGDEIRVPIERINSETGEVTGVGTARVRGACVDDEKTSSGADLILRPGEAFVVAVIVEEP